MPGDEYIFPSNYTFGSRSSLSSHYNPYSSPPTQTLESHVDPLDHWRGLGVSQAHHYDAISAVSGVSSVALSGIPVSEPLLDLYKPIPAYTSSPELENSSYTTPISSSHHYSPMIAYDNNSAPSTPGFPPPMYTSSAMSSYPLIAPQPVMPSRLGKRSYSTHDMSSSPSTPPQPKRRKSTSKDFAMSEDDTLLLKLKDDESLPWKTIAKRFLEQGRGEFKVPTLQMRYKRLKEKIRVWDNEDVTYLHQAKEAIDKEYWELVSRKMQELGCKKKVPGTACEKKWKDLGMEPRTTPEGPPSPALTGDFASQMGGSPYLGSPHAYNSLDDVQELSEHESELGQC
ncbi:hypothetical protein BJ508DRAFT_212743 [Ascobolus immersus RN42]|uniref:Myb-like domain-containing protein n=1 Tax=Ascobolus immersus RN42 TaxID=1160509 RepID=A0A3N4HWT6_ASCIM|nr:hypothetical protein BJ508DRAFT_212743 [Ascobolus immersus RN42]